MNNNMPVSYGKDELTFSINLQENKSEDWMADWSGRVVVEGKTYFLNGYIKKDGWIAGRLNQKKQLVTTILLSEPRLKIHLCMMMMMEMLFHFNF